MVDGNVIALEETEKGVTFTDLDGNASICEGENFSSIKEKIINDHIKNLGYVWVYKRKYFRKVF